MSVAVSGSPVMVHLAPAPVLPQIWMRAKSGCDQLLARSGRPLLSASTEKGRVGAATPVGKSWLSVLSVNSHSAEPNGTGPHAASVYWLMQLGRWLAPSVV